MYFPYLRGKQFELIALKELSSLLAKNRDKVSPIIEPVKDSSTLKTTLKEFASKNINFNIVINPKVGDMQKEKGSNDILTLLQNELSGYTNFQIGIIIGEKENHKSIIALLTKHNLNSKIGITLIHNAEYVDIDEIVKNYNTVAPVKFNVVHFKKTNRRYYRNFKAKTVVELDDCFVARQKNSDYKSTPESGFSEEHLYYKDEGYIGFSDFLTIGDIYSESGFLPYAIAIHLSYSDSAKKIKVMHFVSDSNDDTSDIAGKFTEALNKLVKWAGDKKFTTQAVEIFKELHGSGHFPGLGSVKKLSIMNHIELVLRLI